MSAPQLTLIAIVVVTAAALTPLWADAPWRPVRYVLALVTPCAVAVLVHLGAVTILPAGGTTGTELRLWAGLVIGIWTIYALPGSLIGTWWFERRRLRRMSSGTAGSDA